MVDELTSEAKRSYTILGLVGEGGTGRVYRARMAEGDFHKDVALKMLHDANPSENHLARFRDEARILALFRDRAVVSVDPPVHLAGRWCVVMDFVEGQSASQLLRRQGAFPPTAALAVIAEIARVLRNAYNFPGPRGAPLRLLHRDIKPGNLQITRSGEVRLLDFGSARAAFENREANTSEEISGTPGYIAPERLDGEETPAGDIYSLGITLWCLITNETSVRRWDNLEEAANELAGDDPAIAAALGLAVQMRNRDPEERPTAEEVQNTAQALLAALPGPRLEDWCQSMPLTALEADDLKGQRLTETLHITTNDSVRNASVLTAGLGSMMAFLVVGLVGIGAGVLVILGTVAMQRGPAPKQGQEAPELPAVELPTPKPVPAGQIGVHLRSSPEGATVYVDDHHVGVTPILTQPFTKGSHVVRMKKGLFETKRVVDITAPGTLHWQIMQGNSRVEYYKD